MFRLIVAGSRSFQNYSAAEKILCSVLSKKELNEVVIICGEARGADTIGKIFAIKNGCKVESFIPEWDNLGKKAGIIRNEEMASVADGTILFWDGESRGAMDMYSRTLAHNLPLFVVYFNPDTQEIIKCCNESNPF